jgi:hypothetical protein
VHFALNEVEKELAEGKEAEVVQHIRDHIEHNEAARRR